jgi:hypothetical protein
MLLSVVTGLGHIYLRHYVLGACLFSAFVFGLNGVFIGSVFESDKSFANFVFKASVPFTAAVWLAGLVHAYRISYGTDRAKLRAERAQLFRDGLTLYLRDDLDGAARAFESVVARDVDWEDADALFHLGVVELRRANRHAERGERRSAVRARRRGLRAFRACLAHDDRKKWRGEIAHEQARAKLGGVTLSAIGMPRLPKKPAGSTSSDARPSSIALAPPTSSARVEAAAAPTEQTKTSSADQERST